MNENTIVTMPEEIRSFIDGLLFDAEMLTDDKEFNKTLVDELFARLVEFSNIKLIEKIPQDKLAAFNDLVAKKTSQQELDIFVAQAIPNIQEVYDEIFSEFRDLYMAEGKYADMTNSPAAVKVKGN